MDTSIKLRPLEPASGQALARDLVLKTRRRKGLGEQIAVSKYLDDEFVVCVLLPSCCLRAHAPGVAGVICFGPCRPSWIEFIVVVVETIYYCVNLSQV
jgi:hypothetical protein